MTRPRRVAWCALAALLIAVPLRPDRARAAEPDDIERARAHYQRGAAFYDEQRYIEALREMEAARAFRPVPELDYNIARCHDRLGDVEQAIANYERFLASKPADHTDVRARVEYLRGLRAGGAGIAVVDLNPAATVAVVASPRRTRYSLAVPAAIGGVAVAALAAGGALYGVSGPRYDALADHCLPGCSASRDLALGLERAGIGLLIAGGVVAALDVGLWAAWRRR